MRQIDYKIIVSPSVDRLRDAGTLFLRVPQMAEFLGLNKKTVTHLVYTDRIPQPVQMGLGQSLRWSVLELAEWVEAGCPRRDQWYEIRRRHHSCSAYCLD